MKNKRNPDWKKAKYRIDFLIIGQLPINIGPPPKDIKLSELKTIDGAPMK